MHKKGIKSAAAAALLGGALFAWGGGTGGVDASANAAVVPAIAGISVSLDNYYANIENAEESLSEYLAAQSSTGNVMLSRIGFDSLLMAGSDEAYAALKNIVGTAQPAVEPTTEAPTTEAATEPETEETTAEPTTEAATEPTTEAPTEEPSPYENIAVTEITIVDSFVNVRTAPSTVDGEIVGRIYNHCAATILDRVNGENRLWYYIESGSVKGYIKAEYFVTGDEAEALAVKIGKIFARVNAGGLRLREEPSLEGDNIITNLWEGEIYAVKDVVQSGDEFVHITLGKDDNGNDVSGYVARQYVTVYVEFDTALSLEEIAKIEADKKAAADAAEAARQKAEADKKAAEEAAQKAADAKADEDRQKAEQEAAQKAADAANAQRDSLVSYAKQFLGLAYVWGGESLSSGVDCSGFTMLVYAQYGYSLPHYSGYQANAGTRVSLDSIRPGDLIFYARNGVVYHVAIYIGGGQIIHAANESLGVCISSLNYADIYCAVSLMP